MSVSDIQILESNDSKRNNTNFESMTKEEDKDNIEDSIHCLLLNYMQFYSVQFSGLNEKQKVICTILEMIVEKEIEEETKIEEIKQVLFMRNKCVRELTIAFIDWINSHEEELSKNSCTTYEETSILLQKMNACLTYLENKKREETRKRKIS